ncbi:RNA polymerase sigma factor [Williamwhitmania taraxaci]|uniref:RNA polymerase sigma factor n=1 Tax=Williamwhitmania taraxaci TaxID=1640674 RepID=A0A1G6H5D5_9BACT|nr:RNA polymerase sigma factor [Williamwhitmania taraxaci]SDB89401.1 RNA polymerase sigma-70 factor, ECF subfamily [Williamwhitmania taraxaci]
MMDEDLLIQRILKGETELFSRVVAEHQSKVFHTALGLLHSQHDAEDIAQDVFLEAYRSLATFRNDSKIATWLYRITVNRSLNLLKKRKRSAFIQSFDQLFSKTAKDAEQINDPTPTSQEALEEVQKLDLLHTTVDTLPENQRIAFTLSKYEELSYAEIAEVMHTTVSSVESLIFRARKNVISRIEKTK